MKFRILDSFPFIRVKSLFVYAFLSFTHLLLLRLHGQIHGLLLYVYSANGAADEHQIGILKSFL